MSEALDDTWCPTCGMRWTTETEAHQPPLHALIPCGCSSHESVVDHEKAQHAHGRHNYRAWTKADSRRQMLKAQKRRER